MARLDYPSSKSFQFVVLFSLLLVIVIFSGRGSMASGDAHTAYDFSFPAIDGGEINLSDYRDKLVLLVNTASMCGYTPQYEGLQKLWDDYKDDGLVVLGVPSGDFGGQEYGDDAAIQDFCEVNFDIDFPLTSKTGVKGPDAHPFFKWAEQTLGADNAPQWNFHKYLIGRDGALINSFETRVKPGDDEVIIAIKAGLAD
ncbi:glutathione peroxidase [Thalassospira sp. GB04J01]|uniref:glutathione peroxidase n=1 Tax=Thalassospira sp. GB04J01 TaxID=1485225 RepID=UPI001FCB0963|nr:glutathione peroxidase [Thalassospira sp. GB04J01]